MGSIPVPVCWQIARDSLRPELHFRGLANNEIAKSCMLGNAVKFIERAKRFRGNEMGKEKFLLEEAEAKFKNIQMPFLQASLFSNPAITIYFSIEFPSFEQREKFLYDIEKRNK